MIAKQYSKSASASGAHDTAHAEHLLRSRLKFHITVVLRGFRHNNCFSVHALSVQPRLEDFTLHVHLLYTLLPVCAGPPRADINNYIELGGGVSASPLQLYYQPGATQPEAFAWLTQPGVYYGNFNWDTTQHSRELDHLKNHRLLPYSSSRSDAPTLPVSVVGA